ncbi:MAG: hypothetical protein ACI9NT_000971 [Bacteroidia bacterium]|jgi:hypothetical protein
MANSRDLVQQVAREIEASSKTSRTPPGPNDAAPADRAAHAEAINQVFALFRLNYHNQYYAAFPDAEQLHQIKKLWLESLADFPVEQILKGAKHAIEHSEYLPTLHRMLECCRAGLGGLGLSSPTDAYREACNAASPKSAQPWSHAAVYLAGRDSDWFFLANNTERQTWPIFKGHYEEYCARVLRGESLEIEAPQAIEREVPEPLSEEEQLTELARLREESGL